MVRKLVTSGFLYWSARKAAPKQLIGFLLATDPTLLDQVPADERERAYRILEQMLPSSARWQGMLVAIGLFFDLASCRHLLR